MRPGSVLAAALLATSPAVAQEAPAGTGPRTAPDSAEVLRDARRAQADFERRRARRFPVTLDSYGGSCDERVGRLCSWYDEGEWVPEPEAPEVVRMRLALLGALDHAQALLPGDAWVLGQRVWYRSEAGDLDGALANAGACGDAPVWWCAALEGYVAHRAGRYPEALEAFELALEGMPPERASEWRMPRRAVDGDARAYLDAAPPDSLDAAVERLWRLADPLYLVAGNDRRTAHYARWTVATMREDARNPFRLSWGADLEQLTVRNGWVLGWERAPSRGLAMLDAVVGHKHPQGRDYMPDGEALWSPAAAEAEDLMPGRRHPRSLYAPAYAPVLLPIEGQVAVFPRRDGAVVVATHYLPLDTTFHAAHDHPRPWQDAGDQASLPDRAGLYLVSVDDLDTHGESTVGDVSGALALEVPSGDYVLSVESWSPAERRAGRWRAGLEIPDVTPDLPTLSDLLLLEPGAPEPAALEDAVGAALLRPAVRTGEPLVVGWEVQGLGAGDERLEFHVSVERADRTLVRRAGELLRILGREPAVSLVWAEDRPAHGGPAFRRVSLDLPDLDPGRFSVRLELQLPGRTRLVSEQEFRVRPR